MPRRSLLILTCIMAAVFASLLAYSGHAAEPSVIINEILVGNAGTNIDPDLTNFSGWIELHNTTDKPIKLKKYIIRSWPDGATEPDVYSLSGLRIPANGYLLLWADETHKGNHLPFELDMDGGELRLTAPNGEFDHVVFNYDQSMDVSIGRDGGGDWSFFDQPTPGAANTTPAFATNDDASFTAAPGFSVPGGLHAAPIMVELNSATPGATIRYTTDGSRPTTSSPIYNDPIPVSETTILRARAWSEGLMVSPTTTESFFYGIDANLPVISLVTDDAYLFDHQIGIYVLGQTNKNGKQNWKQKWLRPANIEFYEKAGDELKQEINQVIGLEIYGNSSRSLPQKSFEVKARKVYGDNDLDYEFFPDQKPMDEYRRLILRNGGNDYDVAFLRDPLGHAIARGRLNVDLPAYRPVVVYLNGQYWGIYHMQEKTDEDYVENNYDLDGDEFDMLEITGAIVNGDRAAWETQQKYIKKHNPANEAVYDQLAAQIDIDSYIDYIILQTFVANTDWPRDNTRWWDDYGDEYRWRWILRDLDRALAPKNLKRDMITLVLKGKAPTSYVFKRLWLNEGFRHEFAQRYAAHLNTTFLPARTTSLLDALAGELSAEIPAHLARWGTPEGWEANVEALRNVTVARPSFARETLRKHVGKPGDATLTVHIVGDGHVLVAGAAVPDGYSGPHFIGVPLTLTAIAADGAMFSHWEIVGGGVAGDGASLSLTIDGDKTLIAHFTSP